MEPELEVPKNTEWQKKKNVKQLFMNLERSTEWYFNNNIQLKQLKIV